MMKTTDFELNPLTIAKLPTQARALSRFEAVLVESERLLVEQGLRQFSIPVLAERLGYTRGSIYAYFPTVDAILNELLKRYLAELENCFLERSEVLLAASWREAIPIVIRIAAGYHNSHPAARLLMLGGAFNNDGHSAQEALMHRLGEFSRMVMSHHGIEVPTDPDVTTLAADVGVACFRRSFYLHGEITPAYEQAALHAMRGFLGEYSALENS